MLARNSHSAPPEALTIGAMPRRKNAHGNGGLQHRGGDTWRLNWMTEGQRQYETSHGSEDDAKLLLKRHTLDSAEERMPAGVTQRTVGDVLRWRLKRYRQDKPPSLASIESRMKRLLASELAGIRVMKLRRADLTQFAEELVEDGKAPSADRRDTSPGVLVPHPLADSPRR